MKREDGFYFVTSKITGEQTIAQFEGDTWWMVGCELVLQDADFTVIGDMIEMPV